MDIINGFLLGLSAGINCLIICCPYLIPFFISEQRNINKNFRLIAEYLAGRLSAYLTIAFISSTLGLALSEFHFSDKIYSFFLILSSFLLFLYSFGLIFEFRFLNVKVKILTERLPFFTGFLNGFNFCPPLIAAFSYGVSSANIFKSILFFILFFSGTALYILPFIFSNFAAKVENLRNAGRIAGIFVSIWFFIQGILSFKG